MARYGMTIDLSKCVGCRTCMMACKMENGTPASHFFMYVFRYQEGLSREAKMKYLPRPCMQCEDPPCVSACPVDARIKWKDGLVLTDVDNCQGLRLCESACPYGVNYFNITNPATNQYLDWTNSDIASILGNIAPPNWTPEHEKAYTWDEDPKKKERRVAGAGHKQSTIGKCTFCVHRLEKGEISTACQQACPVSAITFGDLDDAGSDVSQAISNGGSAVYRLKESAGTLPKVYYLGQPPDADASLVEMVEVSSGVQKNGSEDYAGGTVPWK